MTSSAARQLSRRSSLWSDTTRNITQRRVSHASTAQSTSIYHNTWRSTNTHIPAWNPTPATSALSSSDSEASSLITRGLFTVIITTRWPQSTIWRTTCKSYRITKCKATTKIPKATILLRDLRTLIVCLSVLTWQCEIGQTRMVTDLVEMSPFLRTSSRRCTSNQIN